MLDLVVSDLLKENIREATILLALEEEHLENLDWEEMFELLIQTMEMLQVINLEEGTNYELVAAQMLFPIGDRNRPFQAKVAAHNNAVVVYNYWIQQARTVEIWKYAINRHAKPDTALSLAVEGMQHIALSPRSYSKDPRIPSVHCLMRMKRSIQYLFRVGIRHLFGSEAVPRPYRMRGHTNLQLLKPTATDCNGIQMDPRKVLDKRVTMQSKDQPEKDMPSYLRIHMVEFEYHSVLTTREEMNRRRETLDLQEKVNRRRKALGQSNFRDRLGDRASRSTYIDHNIRKEEKLTTSGPGTSRSTEGRRSKYRKTDKGRDRSRTPVSRKLN